MIHTIVVYPQFKFPANKVVPLYVQLMNNGYQLQTMCGIVPFMLLEFYGLIENSMTILGKDTTKCLFTSINAQQKIFTWIKNIHY
jgi:hypothetical protein